MKVKTLIVGLGNPGQKYVHTRHNVGFMVLDKLCSNFKFEKKFNTEVCEFNKGDNSGPRLDGRCRQARMTNIAQITLIKPQTFMNLSGEAVKSYSFYHKISPENIWVVHDDVDVPFGEIRVRNGGSSAGHKGIESVIQHLGSNNFWRFRVGVKNEELEKMEVEDFVLQKFSKGEEKILPQTVEICVKEINNSLRTGKIEPGTLKI